MKVINNITDNVRYFDIRPIQQALISMPETYRTAFFYATILSNINSSGAYSAVGVGFTSEIISEHPEALDKINAIALNLNISTYSSTFDSYKTVKELLEAVSLGGTTAYDLLLSCPELTKEEFYNLSE